MSSTYAAKTLKRGFLDLLKSGIPVELTGSYYPTLFSMATGKNTSQRQSITSASKSFGAKHIFDIPTSYDYIDGVYLSTRIGAGVNVSGATGALCGINMIDKITFRSGKTILEYTGFELLQYQNLVNQSKPDSLIQLYDIMGGDSRNVSANGTDTFRELIVPLYIPGVQADIGYTLSGMVNEQISGLAFPVGLLKANLQVEITFYPTSRIYSTLDGVTEFHSQPILYFDQLSHIPISTAQNINDKGDVDNGLRLGYWWASNNFSFTTSWGVFKSFVAGTKQTDSGGIQGSTSSSGEVVAIFLQAISSANQTAKNHLIGSRLNQIIVTSAGQDLFELDSKEEIEFTTLMKSGGKNYIAFSTAGTNYWYEIPLSVWPISFAQLGVNLNSESPLLTIETLNASAADYTVPLVCFYKCLYKFEGGVCTNILTM